MSMKLAGSVIQGAGLDGAVVRAYKATPLIAALGYEPGHDHPVVTNDTAPIAPFFASQLSGLSDGGSGSWKFPAVGGSDPAVDMSDDYWVAATKNSHTTWTFWPVASLIGPTGATGATGPTGATGATGPAGSYKSWSVPGGPVSPDAAANTDGTPDVFPQPGNLIAIQAIQLIYSGIAVGEVITTAISANFDNGHNDVATDTATADGTHVGTPLDPAFDINTLVENNHTTTSLDIRCQSSIPGSVVMVTAWAIGVTSV